MQPDYLKVNDISIAYRRTNSKPHGILWLGGFNSNMQGSKATALHEFCENQEIPFTRFDYSGHGESGGEFKQGCISIWTKEAEAIAALTQPRLVIGSSMGAWVALLMAQKLPLKGMILLAPAPDFTSKLMWPSFSQEIKDTIMREGEWLRPSSYSPEGYVITRKLIEDGLTQSILDAPLPFTFPIHILQGTKDKDVPVAHALKVFSLLEGTQARFTLIKEGDHSLSRPQDIAFLLETLNQLYHS